MGLINTIKSIIYSIVNNNFRHEREYYYEYYNSHQLKTKGVSAIQNNLSENHELVITVRGKEKYIVMDVKQYNYLRECELDAALQQVKTDYQEGNFIMETVEDHIKRIS